VKFHIPFGIRGQVFLVSLVLLAIPWVGYHYILEVENFLRQGQERTLSGTAQAIATALHDRQQLFEPIAASDKNASRLLYARTLAKPISLDGEAGDWRGQNVKSLIYQDSTNEQFSFTQQTGKYDQFLFFLFEVQDANVITLGKSNNEIDQVDHLDLTFGRSDADAMRFRLALAAPPQVQAFRVLLSDDSSERLEADGRIQAAWHKSKSGYRIEVKIPLEIIGGKVGFNMINISNSAELQSVNQLGSGKELLSVVIPGVEIDSILRGAGRGSARVWVVDHLGRVLARAGSLQSMRPKAEIPDEKNWYRRWARQLHEATLRQIYVRLMKSPNKPFVDDLENATELEGKAIEAAFNGAAGTQWRMTKDQGAIVLSAAQPIWVGDRVAGAVIAEETTNEILALRNQALERLFNVATAVLFLGALTLLLFATRLSKRIRLLRDQAEQALDSKGRIKSLVAGSTAKDEIGDLSRSFSELLNRLADYNGYLEQMAGRVSHEFRTPIAVVRSSLDNLRQQTLSDDATVYVNRAQQGIERLSVILNRMSEATKLEQSLQTAERERFNLNDVLSGCVEGYRSVQTTIPLHLSLPQTQTWMHGAPDLIAQMLDKLVGNALDFRRDGSGIDIRLDASATSAEIIVSNEGPPLPTEMQNQLFDSMVSLRAPQGGDEAHLGLGLYIVRLIAEFHQGNARLENRLDGKGVNAVITLSLHETENQTI
jgi:two-component system, OmpR family, sensor histidine kinase ChvG